MPALRSMGDTHPEPWLGLVLRTNYLVGDDHAYT